MEFWNGLISKKQKYKIHDGLVPTDHNPCLWSNELDESKPWRNVYVKALEYLEKWKLKQINDIEFLHCLRYVAYGYNDCGNDKRTFDNTDVVWPGNLTVNHKPKLVVQIDDDKYTIYFYFDNLENNNPTDDFWKTSVDDKNDFYW
jgi:hypothetical protein